MEKLSKEYTAAERAKVGRNAGIVGIAVNLVLFAMKITAGILFSSVAIIADAVNNLSDAGSSIIMMVGYIFSSKPADRKHPYGHARFEYLSTLFISIIITVLGLELFKGSIDSIISGESASYGTVAVVIMGISVLFKLFLAYFFRRTGKKIDSATLAATAADSIGDVAATSAIIIGIFLTPYTGGATDGVLGCLIAAYILFLGIKLIKESSDTLLGTAPDIETVETVVKKIKSYDGVYGIHDLVMHNYGTGRFFASVHVEMDADEEIMKSHDTIDNIENDILRELGIHLVIHLDPVFPHDERINSLKSAVRGVIDEISCELSSPISMHDFRAVFGITHTNLIFDIVVAHELPISEEQLCFMIREGIWTLNSTYCAVITVDRDYTSTVY